MNSRLTVLGTVLRAAFRVVTRIDVVPADTKLTVVGKVDNENE